ncbi:acyl-CoA dehydrogenase family protein [Microbacterium soli]|uniref:acyl-CoA dehydrogenase family protein n=1 Tax=Microbacterium soli TaxID=446075 RepID=UPI0031D3458F
MRNPSDLERYDHIGARDRLGEVGALGLRLREEGRPVASGTEVRLFAEAIGAALVPVPFFSTTLAVELLGNVEPDLAESIAAGESRCAVALRDDFSGLAEVGEAAIAWDAKDAEFAVAVGAVTDETVEIVKAPLTSGSCVASPLDPTRWCAATTLDDAESIGFVSREQHTRWQAMALMLASADAVGAMRQTLENAIEYSKQRHAYGRPIGSFQALQHLMVEAYVDLQPASAHTSFAAWALDELSADEALRAARSAKAYVSRIGLAVAERSMQVFGGIGVTREHVAHLFTRRVMADRMILGSEDEHFGHLTEAPTGGN